MISFRAVIDSFDVRAIRDATDKANRRALQRFGFKVRQDAMESIVEAPFGVAAPAGQPPHSHAGARWTARAASRHAAGKAIQRGKGFAGLKLIRYHVNGSQSVIIGPASNRTRSVTIPEIEEEGLMGISARPFMGPSFREAQTSLDSFWANSVKP